MRTPLAWITAILISLPLASHAQDGRSTLEAAATALGAGGLKSLEYSGSGVHFVLGQSASPGQPGPRFREKLLVEADVFTPPPAGTPPPMPPSPFTVQFAATLKRLNLDVARLLPLHGRSVPIADLHGAVGHGH